MNIRNFSIRFRMYGAIAMVLSLIVLVGATGIWGLNSLNAQSTVFEQTTFKDSQYLSSLRHELGNVRRFEKDIALNFETQSALSGYMSQWRAACDAALQHAGALAADGKSEQARIASGIVSGVTAYVGAAKTVLEATSGGQFKSSQEINAALGPAKKSIREAEVATVKLADVLEGIAKQDEADRQHSNRVVFTWFVAAMVLAALIVVPLTLWNMHSICDPIQRSIEVAEKIAQGDLTQDQLDLSGSDEATQLLRALHSMLQNLQTMVGAVATTSSAIDTASSEIAAGNQDLSARTEGAASNLEETASALEQMTSSVQNSAQSADRARHMATSAADVALRGGSLVGDVVSTMDAIHASSQKISDIISVIDGIAFQTNILALNAAVEAARAGEQGRGFAVVASEVRSLAGRCTEAAKEIKTLIQASVERVESGASLVRNTGATMSEIVSSVRQLSDMIGEVAQVSQEQSSGIGSVNTAVSQLDHMTQQNAALVEQNAAATESLKEQAQRLVGIVGRFRLS